MASSEKISGVDGDAVFNSSTVKITGWTLNVSQATKDVTDSSSSSWKEKLPDGFSEWGGTFEGFVIDGTNTQVVGTSATLTLTAETGVTYAGTAILTSKDLSLTVSGGDAHKVAYSFEGDGVLTETNAA